MMELLKDPAFWVAASLGTFIVILIVLKVPGMALKALDGRANSIKTEIDEARRLRDEAQALLAEQQRRQAQAKSQTDEMVAQARAEARRAAEEAKTELAATIERRRKQAEDKIARAQVEAEADIRAYAGSVSIGAARRLIAAQMDEARSSRLIDGAIADLPKQLRSR
ncbi:MAG: ATP F0F1 synthase subunit B [Alphaproteobacteria bacterium]